MLSKKKTVPAYISEAPVDRRPILKKLRAMIRKTAPRAKDTMREGVPLYEIGDEMLCALASQKQYVAFYVCNVKIPSRLKAELGKANCGKSCVRYRKPGDVVIPALQKLLRLAMKEMR